jgi:hypothetical protein
MDADDGEWMVLNREKGTVTFPISLPVGRLKSLSNTLAKVNSNHKMEQEGPKDSDSDAMAYLLHSAIERDRCKSPTLQSQHHSSAPNQRALVWTDRSIWSPRLKQKLKSKGIDLWESDQLSFQ